MPSRLNRFSFAVLAVILLAVAAFAFLRNGITGWGLAVVVLIAFLLALAGYLLRYRQTPVDSLQHLQGLIRGKPTLLEFYSDY